MTDSISSFENSQRVVNDNDLDFVFIISGSTLVEIR